MKLVNPEGRDISTFSTEVHRCPCMCNSAWASGRNRANTLICGCECSSNKRNMNANRNAAQRA